MRKKEWLIKIDEDNKRLYTSRNTEHLSSYVMTIDDIEYEMSKGKDRKIIEIAGINQECLDYFVDKYGAEYEYIYFHMPKVKNFNSLEKLANLQGVTISGATKSESLWDMSNNKKIWYLHIVDSKSLIYNPTFLNAGIHLEEIIIASSIWSDHAMKNLEWLNGLKNLKKLELWGIKLEEKNIDVLSFVPKIEEFNFDSYMFTTEQIAYMCAKFPYIKGRALCAYNTCDAYSKDVKVCGYRKPELSLPKDQARLDKYIKEFNELVEFYKNEK